MVFKNLKIVTLNSVIENGFISFENGKIIDFGSVDKLDKNIDAIDMSGKILMPGFIDVHIHGSSNIDFMDATTKDYEAISSSLFKEGVTSYLATTLTSDTKSLERVCESIREAKKDNPSLLGIHFEGPYICEKYKGAQNEAFIRNPDIEEFKHLQEVSGNNVRYISLAPEKEHAMEFIKYVSSNGVTVSAGHSDATFDDVKEAIDNGLTNTTHTHNAMSGHHHRNPGVVTAAMYFNELYTEVICDLIHVCPNTLKTFYKIVGPDRFVIITDALKIKHSDVNEFQLMGLDCIRKNGAAYLTTGPLAGSLLSMDQAIRNVRDVTGASLIELAKISSYNAAKSLHLTDRGLIEKDKLADFVILNQDLTVNSTYKLGKKVY